MKTENSPDLDEKPPKEKPAKTNAEFDAALTEFLVGQGIDKKDIKVIFTKPLPKKGES